MSFISKAQSVIDAVYALRKTNEPRYPNERYIPFTGHTQAGVYVTPDRALMNDTIWAAHRYLTQTVAQLPAKIVRKTPNGNETVDIHPVDNVLNWRTNPEMSPFQFKETMVGWAILHGNGIAEIERDAVGRVVNLWPIHPRRIYFLRDLETGELIYRVNNSFGAGPDASGEGQNYVELRPNDVFHLRGFGNSAVGLSVVEYAAQSIGWARAAELFSASFFGEGMHFGGTIISDTKLDKDSTARIREELEQTFRGPNRAGKWFIGDNGLKVTNTTSTARDAQFTETLQFQVESICRWMGVPPHKVHHLLRMTYNNVEQMSIDVVGDSIIPWAMRFEQEATYKLFGNNRGNLCVVLEVKGLLRGSQKDRQEALAIQFEHGIINGNDWADLEDQKKPKDGDKYYIAGNNLVPVEQVLNPPKPVAPSPPQQSDPQIPANDTAAWSALFETETILNPENINA
jgi:HK97 family phage portal protein